jgi:hypothetical protein
VQLGASNAEYVEVRQGLKPGSAVLLAISDEMRRLIPDTTPPEVEMPPRQEPRGQSGGEPRRAGGPPGHGGQRRPPRDSAKG